MADDAPLEAAFREGWRAAMRRAADIAEPPLMHRRGRVGLWRQRRAAIADAIRSAADEAEGPAGVSRSSSEPVAPAPEPDRG